MYSGHIRMREPISLSTLHPHGWLILSFLGLQGNDEIPQRGLLVILQSYATEVYRYHILYDGLKGQPSHFL